MTRDPNRPVRSAAAVALLFGRLDQQLLIA